MAQQPSSPASKSEGITLEAAYGSLASGQIGSMEELDTLFEATKLPQHPRNALSRQP
jgi:urease accessory protein UreF